MFLREGFQFELNQCSDNKTENESTYFTFSHCEYNYFAGSFLPDSGVG